MRNVGVVSLQIFITIPIVHFFLKKIPKLRVEKNDKLEKWKIIIFSKVLNVFKKFFSVLMIFSEQFFTKNYKERKIVEIKIWLKF